MTEENQYEVKETAHYVDNEEFSRAVQEYNEARKKAKENGEPIPVIPNYIGECFIKIAYGVANRYNFNRYSYKEDMIADAIECCVRYIHNFDISKTKKDGTVSAFSYFTKTVYWAFVRRIKKENAHYEKIQNIIEQSNIEMFLSQEELNEIHNSDTSHVYNHYIENLINHKLMNK
jgi:hypothetical protein